MQEAYEWLRRTAAQQDGITTRRQALEAGLSPHALRELLAAGALTTLLPGAHLLEELRAVVDLRRAWARAVLVRTPGAVVGLSSAAALHGVQGAPRCGAVQVLARAHLHRREHVEPHRAVLAPEHVVDLDGLAVTSIVRTLADLVPRLDRPDALAVLDPALRLGLATHADLSAAARLAGGRRGCRAVGDLFALADGRAETPLESRARLRCLDAGLVPVALQLEVRAASGQVVARSDLAFERRDPSLPLLLLEADGAEPHSVPEALLRDRWRQNALVALGHPVVRCTWADTCRPLTVPAMVRAAL